MTKNKQFKKTTQKQKIITVTGANYIEEIVPELLEKAFKTYCIRDFSKKSFQSSVHENANATSAIVLTVLGIEAHRNRIYYLIKKKVDRNVSKDLSSEFYSRDQSFPKDKFEKILNE